MSAKETFAKEFPTENKVIQLISDWENLIKHLQSVDNPDYIIYKACLKQLNKVLE